MYARNYLSGATPVQQPSDEQIAAAVEAFRLLADATRLRLLWALADGSERDVTDLCGQVGGSRPLTSQHLARLRYAGMVTTRREGRRVFYRARGSHVRGLVAEALFHADHQQVSGADEHD
jgi:DNA-binding transcriptional ArsR family regulator